MLLLDTEAALAAALCARPGCERLPGRKAQKPGAGRLILWVTRNGPSRRQEPAPAGVCSGRAGPRITRSAACRSPGGAHVGRRGTGEIQRNTRN